MRVKFDLQALFAALIAWSVVGCASTETMPVVSADAGLADALGGADATEPAADAGGLDAQGGADAAALDAGAADVGAATGDAGSAVDPACAVDGCLRVVTKIGDYTQAQLQALLPPGTVLDNGYSVFFLKFYTDGLESTAVATIPLGAAPSGGYHIVGNNHGTTGIDDPCAPSASVSGAGLAGLFGGRGMIGVAVDYPGLGTPGVHPYLVSRVEGTSSLDALRAATLLAAAEGAPVSGRYASVGLSQGGHATIAAAALHRSYAPELDIRAFGATAPGNTVVASWSQGIRFPGPHMVFYALLVHAWSQHYQWQVPPLWADSIRSRIAGDLTSHCIFSATGGPVLATVVPQSPAALFHPDFIAAFSNLDWGAYAPVGQAFAANVLGPYEQSAPLRIYQGSADTVVAQAATDQLVRDLMGGGVTVDYVVVPGGAHSNVAFGWLGSPELRGEEALTWLRERLGS